MAGKAANPLSVNQAPQYGDKSILDSFRRETTTTPMTGNVIPKTPAGRPASGNAPSVPPQGLPPETYAKMQALARAKKTANFWAQMEQNSPSPVTRFYNYHAQEAYKKAAKAVYASTPNFE